MTNEEAIKKLEQHKIEYLSKFVDFSGITEALDAGIQALNETKWIPVSKKRPKFNETVLATVDDVDGLRVIIINYYGEDFWFNGRITAWMPLPKPHPYKESEEE